MDPGFQDSQQGITLLRPSWVTQVNAGWGLGAPWPVVIASRFSGAAIQACAHDTSRAWIASLRSR